VLLFSPLYIEAADLEILINGQGLLGRELLRPVKIDLECHSTSRPHQIALKFVTGDNSSRISGNLPPEVMLDKGINLSMLYDHILKRVGHVICPSIISMSHYGKGRGGVARRGPQDTNRSG
jgi:hypothetical protein